MEKREEAKAGDQDEDEGLVINIPSGLEEEEVKYDVPEDNDSMPSTTSTPRKEQFGCCRQTLMLLLWDKRTVGAMSLMALSAFVYSLQNMDVKKAGENHGFWTIAFFRGVVGATAALLSAVCTKTRKGPIYGAQWENIKWLILRGLLGGATIICSFGAVVKIELSDATVLSATSPLWTAVLALFFDKGAWNRGDTLATIFCLAGIVLVAKPEPLFDSPRDESTAMLTEGVLCALASAISQAGVNITIRKIREEDTSVITLYAMMGCVIMALPGMIWEQSTKPERALDGMSPTDMAPLLATGMLSYGGQMLKTLALQMSRGVGVLVMRYSETIWSFVWQCTVFHKSIDIASICGALLIISGCFMSMFAKTISELMYPSRARRPSFSEKHIPVVKAEPVAIAVA